MLLERLTVENYRALRHAQVAFDETTVLIGENDSGRTTLLEALALTLGWRGAPNGFSFDRSVLPREDGQRGPTRLVLELLEPQRGAWDGEDWAPWAKWLEEAPQRRVKLEVTLSPDGQDALKTAWRFVDGVSGGAVEQSEALLGFLRGALPVFWLPTGMVLDRSSPVAASSNVDLLREIEASYHELLDARVEPATDSARKLERGYRAAQELAKQLMEPPAAAPSSTPALAMRHQRDVTLALEHGSAASKIGLLLLVGGLLRAWTGRPRQLGRPLLLLEAPEAYLHPMTLASVWRIIERLKGQKVIGTHSPVLVGAAPVASLRRLVRKNGEVSTFQVPPGGLSPEDERRYTYHLRSRRADASFGRVWLLVEGETEFWLMPELARVLGYDFTLEGIHCVEFAQAGLPPLLKVARHLGMGWHVLTDGDTAGRNYLERARGFLAGEEPWRHLTLLPQRDLENCFWASGYSDFFRRAAGITGRVRERAAPIAIRHAIRKHSKPGLALMLLDEVSARGPRGVPEPLRRVIESCVRQARGEPAQREAPTLRQEPSPRRRRRA
ncbi:MAG: DUF2813 domain-containing protein [Myxococcales bacterium]|nr:DUF2813 domain-containing protein [Myxococcales bacterium]